MSWEQSALRKNDVEKFEIFLGMKKTKSNQGGAGRGESTSGPSTTDTSHHWDVNAKFDLAAFLSDEDLSSTNRDLELALKNLTENRSGDDFRKVQGKDVFLSQTIKSENTDPVLTEFKSVAPPSMTKAAHSGLAGTVEEIKTLRGSVPHFVKHVERDGKVIKVWQCGTCARNFQHQYTLMRHLPTHTNVRNFICNECGKAFRQLSTLSQHRAIHSVERPYACETCSKSFNRISTLISHRKTHSDVKPFRCHMCHKGFHQKGNLRNHIYIHTNERPYRCTLCNKGFNQMSNLVCHTQKSHSAELGSIWACHRCNMTYSKRTLLRAHELETHHILGSSSRSSRAKSSNARKKSTSSSSDELKPAAVADEGSTSKISEIGIYVPAIDTDAMKTAKANKEIPFAVLHFFEGLPFLVRIIDSGNQSLLRPVNSDDFESLKSQQQKQPDKVSVPIVAAVYQTSNISGGSDFTVMPPKNIYKFINQQQTMSSNYETEKKSIKSEEPPLENVISLMPPQIPSDLRDVTTGSSETPLFETLASVKDEPDENSMDYSNGLMNDKPRAIAISEESTWWKKLHKVNPYDEPDGFSETFQNIATGSLLTPKKITESDIMPDQNATILDISGAMNPNATLNYNPSLALNANNNINKISFDDIDIHSSCVSSFLEAARNEGMVLNTIRNLFAENENLLHDFRECLSEILQ